jgi:hypothetical protein
LRASVGISVTGYLGMYFSRGVMCHVIIVRMNAFGSF